LDGDIGFDAVFAILGWRAIINRDGRVRKYFHPSLTAMPSFYLLLGINV